MVGRHKYDFERSIGRMGVFRGEGELYIRARLPRLLISSPQVLELNELLKMTPILSVLAPVFITIVQKALKDASASQEQFRSTFANSAWVLGSCLSAISRSAVRDGYEVDTWAEEIINHWSWSEVVMRGIVDLIKATS